MSLLTKIFPYYNESEWREVCLDDQAAMDFPVDQFPENPLLDPSCCMDWIESRYGKYNKTFGGYAENRSNLWRGHYMQPDRTIHLGVDFNSYVGDDIHSPVNGTVFDIWCDIDLNGGWGTRLIIESETLYVIFAHIDTDYCVEVGDEIKIGDKIAVITEDPFNGGWFPHLHVQCVSKAHNTNWETLDGYGEAEDLKWNLNPMEVL
jgi:murein DD-endopeptidase MepM/ murein hydrolase activator NlpD